MKKDVLMIPQDDWSRVQIFSIAPDGSGFQHIRTVPVQDHYTDDMDGAIRMPNGLFVWDYDGNYSIIDLDGNVTDKGNYGQMGSTVSSNWEWGDGLSGNTAWMSSNKFATTNTHYTNEGGVCTVLVFDVVNGQLQNPRDIVVGTDAEMGEFFSTNTCLTDDGNGDFILGKFIGDQPDGNGGKQSVLRRWRIVGNSATLLGDVIMSQGGGRICDMPVRTGGKKVVFYHTSPYSKNFTYFEVDMLTGTAVPKTGPQLFTKTATAGHSSDVAFLFPQSAEQIMFELRYGTEDTAISLSAGVQLNPTAGRLGGGALTFDGRGGAFMEQNAWAGTFSGGMTVEFYFKPEALGTRQRIAGAADEDVYGLWLCEDGRIELVFQSFYSPETISSVGTVVAGQYNHVVFAFHNYSANWTFVINGAVDPVKPWATSGFFVPLASVGGTYSPDGTSTTGLVGAIDGFVVWQPGIHPYPSIWTGATTIVPHDIIEVIENNHNIDYPSGDWANSEVLVRYNDYSDGSEGFVLINADGITQIDRPSDDLTYTPEFETNSRQYKWDLCGWYRVGSSDLLIGQYGMGLYGINGKVAEWVMASSEDNENYMHFMFRNSTEYRVNGRIEVDGVGVATKVELLDDTTSAKLSQQQSGGDGSYSFPCFTAKPKAIGARHPTQGYKKFASMVTPVAL